MVDLWLQLLQRTLHLSQKLPRGPSGPVSRQGSLSEGLDPALDIKSQVGTLVKSYRASLQELMTQLLVHWKVTLSTHDQQAAWNTAHTSSRHAFHLLQSGRTVK